MMKNYPIILTSLLFSASFVYLFMQHQSKLTGIQSLASQLASGVDFPIFNLKTAEGFNTDCLKAIKLESKQLIGKAAGYNALYLAEMKTTFDSANWTRVARLSERGSQGYVYQVPKLASLLVLYQLQNYEHGNTLAIRYYESYTKLKSNNFLYEYQLQQRISKVGVVNVGTPSVEGITPVTSQKNPHQSRFNLTLKFHYSPDGQRDLPGYGYVNLVPLRDFVDSQGKWVGGCKQGYSDWEGSTDSQVQAAIGRAHVYSKIGQRDLFTLTEQGITRKYYLYQVNINPSFSWEDWRIYLYSQQDNQAVQVPFPFGQDDDIAKHHISLLSYDPKTNSYTFFPSFYLPSEGVRPDPNVRAGQMTCLVTILP